MQSPLSVRVTPEPGIWARYWWAFMAGAVLLVLVAVAVIAWRGQRRRRRDPFGLLLQLVSPEGDILSEHPAGHGHKQWYEFTVVEPHRSPRIERRTHGQYAVQRSPEGGAVLRKRGSGRTRLPVQGRVELTDTLSLALGTPPGTPAAGPSAPAAADGGANSYDDTYL